MDSEMVVQGSVIAWLGVCAWRDWKQREVSNRLTLPPVGVAILLRLLGMGSGSPQEVLAVLLLLAVAWFARVAGGADVKAGVALTILSPALAGWAWIGAVVCYFALRLSGKQVQRFPGMVGFFVGTLAYDLWMGLV